MLKSLAIAIAIAAALALCAPVYAADLTVHFLDVGQGDAFFIVSPAGKTVLIDAGPPNHADRFVRRLKQLTSRPLDLVILTHAHADHMAGMESIRGRCRRARRNAHRPHARPTSGAAPPGSAVPALVSELALAETLGLQ